MFLSRALLLATAASWAYWLVALVSVRRLFRPARPALPRAEGAAPPVSLLKPVRGVDAGARASFESFLRLDYPCFELLFGVADPRDPVLPVLERLREEHPEVPIRILVVPAPGPNRKASLLEALARAARYEVLVATDADMRVSPDYLREVVEALSAPGVGLVTCTYRGADARSVPARLEALHMGATFLPSAVVANRVFGLPFAMGSTMALRRADLDAIGGFGALAGYLADDYQLGAKIAGLGRRVVICPHVVASVLGRTTLREDWAREVRWARCTRVSQPLGHFGYALTFATPLAAAAVVASGFAAAGWAALATSLALRWIAAAGIARATGDGESLRALPLLPLRDLLSAAVWVAALVGRRVLWRGEVFEVDRAGRLRPVSRPDPGAAAPGARSRAHPEAR